MSVALGAQPLSGLVELARLELAPEAIGRRLKITADVLSSPAEHLHVLKSELRLDRMNVIVENGNAREGTTIELRLARVPETAGAMRAFALVKLARSELLHAPSLVHEERMFLI